MGYGIWVCGKVFFTRQSTSIAFWALKISCGFSWFLFLFLFYFKNNLSRVVVYFLMVYFGCCVEFVEWHMP